MYVTRLEFYFAKVIRSIREIGHQERNKQRYVYQEEHNRTIRVVRAQGRHDGVTTSRCHVSVVLLQEATDEGRINKPSFTTATQPVTERKREPLRFLRFVQPPSLSLSLSLPTHRVSFLSRDEQQSSAETLVKPALLAVIQRLASPSPRFLSTFVYHRVISVPETTEFTTVSYLHSYRTPISFRVPWNQRAPTPSLLSGCLAEIESLSLGRGRREKLIRKAGF